jgi:hypothetical protein
MNTAATVAVSAVTPPPSGTKRTHSAMMGTPAPYVWRPGPPLDSEVTYIGEMAIHSTLVQTLQVNADVHANTMIDTDPDEMGRLPSRQSVSAMQQTGGPTDAVDHDTDKAHAQTSSLDIPKLCFRSTATPANRDVHSGSVVHSSPHSHEDFDSRCPTSSNDHQSTQSPAEVGPVMASSRDRERASNANPHCMYWSRLQLKSRVHVPTRSAGLGAWSAPCVRPTARWPCYFASHGVVRNPRSCSTWRAGIRSMTP